eukprot:TRINITY_DN23171_c0_g1_i1.p1 TRINITY_DN23171_c0_g1~~TRINITY_DN23171_c0_g1_i1.p1  ORF type:complete len:634 (+),score=140.96 TRINITY_DN23171_c0_g1_i1:204-2105(+)
MASTSAVVQSREVEADDSDFDPNEKRVRVEEARADGSDAVELAVSATTDSAASAHVDATIFVTATRRASAVPGAAATAGPAATFAAAAAAASAAERVKSPATAAAAPGGAAAATNATVGTAAATNAISGSSEVRDGALRERTGEVTATEQSPPLSPARWDVANEGAVGEVQDESPTLFLLRGALPERACSGKRRNASGDVGGGEDSPPVGPNLAPSERPPEPVADEPLKASTAEEPPCVASNDTGTVTDVAAAKRIAELERENRMLRAALEMKRQEGLTAQRRRDEERQCVEERLEKLEAEVRSHWRKRVAQLEAELASLRPASAPTGPPKQGNVSLLLSHPVVGGRVLGEPEGQAEESGIVASASAAPERPVSAAPSFSPDDVTEVLEVPLWQDGEALVPAGRQFPSLQLPCSARRCAGWTPPSPPAQLTVNPSSMTFEGGEGTGVTRERRGFLTSAASAAVASPAPPVPRAPGTPRAVLLSPSGGVGVQEHLVLDAWDVAAAPWAAMRGRSRSEPNTRNAATARATDAELSGGGLAAAFGGLYDRLVFGIRCTGPDALARNERLVEIDLSHEFPPERRVAQVDPQAQQCERERSQRRDRWQWGQRHDRSHAGLEAGDFSDDNGSGMGSVRL